MKSERVELVKKMKLEGKVQEADIRSLSGEKYVQEIKKINERSKMIQIQSKYQIFLRESGMINFMRQDSYAIKIKNYFSNLFN
jgi:hypothetical protein